MTDGAHMRYESPELTWTVSLEWLTAALRAVAEGDTPVAAVRHPLGFLCLPIQREGPVGLCVHVWTGEVAQAEPTTSHVHCHSWDLHSQVLYGRVRNTVISADDAADEPTHRVYEVHSADGVDELRATSQVVRCTEGAVEVRVAGDVYTLPAGVFHMTTVEGADGTATAVLGETLVDGTDRSLGPVAGRTHHVRRQYCDAAETARAARIVVERLVQHA